MHSFVVIGLLLLEVYIGDMLFETPYVCLLLSFPFILSLTGDGREKRPRHFYPFLTLSPYFLPPSTGGRRDKDGFVFVTGRVDDVMNVSGHRIGTAEVESALTIHPAVVEAAVIQVRSYRCG